MHVAGDQNVCICGDGYIQELVVFFVSAIINKFYGFNKMNIQFELVQPSATFYELEQVLKRDKFDAWQPLFTRLAWLHEFKLNVHFVEPVELVDDCRDKKDNQFLDIAIAANADILVSSDVHLLELNPYRNTGIMQLAEFNAVLSFQPLR